jgi:hypothetical protein
VAIHVREHKRLVLALKRAGESSPFAKLGQRPRQLSLHMFSQLRFVGLPLFRIGTELQVRCVVFAAEAVDDGGRGAEVRFREQILRGGAVFVRVPLEGLAHLAEQFGTVGRDRIAAQIRAGLGPFVFQGLVIHRCKTRGFARRIVAGHFSSFFNG